MPAKKILAWDDDPGSAAGVEPALRMSRQLKAAKLVIKISGKAVPAARYEPDTAEFRYWTASDALARSLRMWSAWMPATSKWQTGKTLPVHLDEGRQLNAFYARGGDGDRPGLSFFGDVIAGKSIYAGESPDIATHELGHAVLDALRPGLWDVVSAEAAALHEAFGDISAVLSALQLQSMRELVLEETGGKIFRSSRVSRLAEQLGWAVRQSNPTAADTDCMRNAVNSFFYRDPATLPPSAPAAMLSTEPHSFSRVFTGAFMEMLAGIFMTMGKKGSEAQLLDASVVAGQLLVDAVIAASIVPAYFSQVAAQCIEADAVRYQKKYRDVIKGAFVRRGILSLDAATKLRARRRPAGRSAGHSLHLAAVNGVRYGLDEDLYVTMPDASRRYDVAPSRSDRGSLPPITSEHAAEHFIEDLFRRGRVDLTEASGDADAMLTQPFIRKTHKIRCEENHLTLRRRIYDCGFD